MSKTRRIAVTIVKSTPKAHLISDSAGRRGWIQRRWLADDGTVAAATFERAAEQHGQAQADRAAYREWKEAYHEITVARETEKALAIKMQLGLCSTDQAVERLLWVPKSLMRDGQAPGWFLLKKVRETMDDAHARYRQDCLIETIGIADWIN